MRSLIIAATILAPATAFAGGYLVPSMDPRDLALGGSSVADAQGAGAVSLNTAALAGQEGLDIGIAGGVINNSTTWKDGSDSASQSQVGTPPSVAVSYGKKLPNNQAIGFGVGFGVAGGGAIKWPDGWVGQETFQSVNQQIFGISAGVGFQALPWLKFGASYVRFQATEEIHQKLNYLDHLGDAGIATAGGGNTFGVAAEVRVPTAPLSLGVTYLHTANLDMTGHVHFTDVPPSFQTLLHDQGVTRTILIPDVVFIGAAYEAIPNLKLMAAFSWEHWSDYKADTFTGTDKIMNSDGTTSQFSASVPRNDDNATVYRIAAEYAKLGVPELTVRGAVLRSMSGQNTKTLSPSLTDANSWALSVGAGYAFTSSVRVDAGLQVALFDEIKADVLPDTFQGTYNTHVFLASVGLNWRSDLGMARAK
jgi:long-chain fatty acid transport protein